MHTHIIKEKQYIIFKNCMYSLEIRNEEKKYLPSHSSSCMFMTYAHFCYKIRLSNNPKKVENKLIRKDKEDKEKRKCVRIIMNVFIRLNKI